MKPRRPPAFTLIELLVVTAVIALLIGILMPTLGAARRQARAVKCLAQMRTLGQALTLYLQDHADVFPSTNHAGFGGGPTWDVQLSPYLGAAGVYRAVAAGDFYLADNPDAVAYYNTPLRCPEDTRTAVWHYSYGQNVYFNLDPSVPDEAGVLDGRLWTQSVWLPAPSATVVYGEVESSANHVMAHFWRLYNAPSEIVERHDDTGHFVFADGHAARSAADEQFDTSRAIDRWDPATAR